MDELKILREYYPTGGTKECAKRINRSRDAIRQAARLYGIRANTDIYKPINKYIRMKTQ